ncbi:MAG: hypothetical protein M3279_10760 [Actinomycetota bacterium]|nr:hypothetical protein [Actinomycetota bacterium]
MTRRSLPASAWLVLLALAGLLAGHVASYFVVAPDAHERAELLALTGHSEHGVFGTIALAAGFAGIIGLFMQTVRRRCGRSGRRTVRAGVATLLWAVQTCGFVALETWERGHGLAGVAELVHEPAFLVGLVAQVAVALVATAVVLLVRATAEAWLRRVAAPATESEPIVFPAAPGPRPRASVARAAWNLRGPPSPLGSPS